MIKNNQIVWLSFNIILPNKFLKFHLVYFFDKTECKQLKIEFLEFAQFIVNKVKIYQWFELYYHNQAPGELF